MGVMDRRRALMGMQKSELPGMYRKIEWLGTNGTGAYINSGIECTSLLKVEFGFSIQSYVNSALCGGLNTSNAPVYFRHHCTPNNGYIYWYQYNNFNTGTVYGAITLDSYNEVMVDPVNGLARYNKKDLTFSTIQGYRTTGKSYGILGRISNDGTIQSRPSRIYYFRFYLNDNLVGNFIPCVRKSDSEPGMYDTVTKAFFTNAGTGNFIVPT